MAPESPMIPLGVGLVHLVSGEDVIARVEYDAEAKAYVLYSPKTPIMKPKVSPTGEQVGESMALIPYRPFTDADAPLIVRETNVLFVAPVVDGIQEFYQDLTRNAE
jgi:hypothetical protein